MKKQKSERRDESFLNAVKGANTERLPIKCFQRDKPKLKIP